MLIIRWLAYAALLVPLVFSVDFYPSHIALQTFLFRAIVEVMMVVYVALLLKNSFFAPKSSAVLWAFVAYVAALMISAFAGEGAYRSFFSDFERHWGVVTIAHFFLFFLVLASVFRDASSWKKFFSVSAGASALVALYGLYQFLFEDIGRVYSTVGNAGFLATYLLLNAVIAVGLLKERPRWVWRCVAAFDAVAAILTATRGAALAFIAGVVVFGIGYLFFGKESTKRGRTYLVVAALALLLFGGLAYSARDSASMRAYGLNRLFHISLSEVTAKTRLYAWTSAWKGFLERPLLGAGPEHFNTVFNRHFNSDFYTYEIGETEFDHAHNIF
ncbi:O-antigen ligase family protein, partial [Candidatus Azambacteria bacterium]|nr:O-antigen ligase family protein [Candidatus Azambacteria bacterium]